MKLATIEKIENIYPHPDPETCRLECVKVLGYQCIVPINKFKKDQKVVYIKPDTILPDDEWAQTFKKYAPKRVKAAKIRGHWSEGIVTSIEDLPFDFSGYNIGDDISELIKIDKYEPPIPKDVKAKGNIPYNIPVTDEERWENIYDYLPFGEKVDGTIKIDGQSSSYYYHIEDDVFGVIGRKHELKQDIVNPYTVHIEKYDIENKLKNFCKKYNVSLCIRGESYGKGIQGHKINPHGKLNNGWKMFSVYNITERKYEKKGDRFYFLDIAEELGLPTVDLIEEDVILTEELIKKYSTEINEIQGQPFEGVVFQSSKGSFKVINKYYDSKK